MVYMKTKNESINPSFRSFRICSHSVAVADKTGNLRELIKGVRISYRASITYPESDGGAGRKGGRKRKHRIYINREEEEGAAKRVSSSPFTEIFHNNKPLILCNINDVPQDKN
eukprot:Seg4749.2 transcript_id=Seg4749.2/GoldUCD/mRNA.D3Y31 product="hypothetical protein" protein_id=Seg4749.2/GoldUCD/D3Y31